MVGFRKLVTLRLHPLQDGYFATSMLAETPNTYSDNGETITCTTKIETAGWSHVVLRLNLEGFWDRYKECSRIVGTICHYDGMEERFVLHTETTRRGEWIAERPMILAERDGSFRGLVKIKLEPQSYFGATSTIPRLPVFEGIFTYKPSSISYGSAQERYETLHPFLVNRTNYAHPHNNLWTKFDILGRLSIHNYHTSRIDAAPLGPSIRLRSAAPMSKSGTPLGHGGPFYSSLRQYDSSSGRLWPFKPDKDHSSSPSYVPSTPRKPKSSAVLSSNSSSKLSVQQLAQAVEARRRQIEELEREEQEEARLRAEYEEQERNLQLLLERKARRTAISPPHVATDPFVPSSSVELARHSARLQERPQEVQSSSRGEVSGFNHQQSISRPAQDSTRRQAGSDPFEGLSDSGKTTSTPPLPASSSHDIINVHQSPPMSKAADSNQPDQHNSSSISNVQQHVRHSSPPSISLIPAKRAIEQAEAQYRETAPVGWGTTLVHKSKTAEQTSLYAPRASSSSVIDTAETSTRGRASSLDSIKRTKMNSSDHDLTTETKTSPPMLLALPQTCFLPQRLVDALMEGSSPLSAEEGANGKEEVEVSRYEDKTDAEEL